MSTPLEPGCNHIELNGRLGPRPGGGITLRCVACLSKDRGRPHSERATVFVMTKTLGVVTHP